MCVENKINKNCNVILTKKKKKLINTHKNFNFNQILFLHFIKFK